MAEAWEIERGEYFQFLQTRKCEEEKCDESTAFLGNLFPGLQYFHNWIKGHEKRR